jgi:uncharacterized membrane protein YczE
MFYLIGILLLTLGVTLTIRSNLGTSPFDALLVGLFKTIGLTVGSWEIILGLTIVLINAMIQRQQPEYMALLTSLITGMGIDGWLWMLRWIHPDTFMSRFLLIALGMIIVGLGTAIYLQSRFAPIPIDRSMLIIQELTGKSITYSRALISILLVILAFILKGPIGIGTLLNAFLVGGIIQFFMPYVSQFEQRISKQA